MNKKNSLILALDVLSRDKALELTEQLVDHFDAIKVGYPLILHAGLGIVEEISSISPVIADLKIADTPNTNRLICEAVLGAGLPRPKMLRRTLQTIASMGVAKLVLINSYRVEKSFWQTPFLQPEALHEQLLLGLEQARDTVLPELILAKRFKPFVEDQLPSIVANT